MTARPISGGREPTRGHPPSDPSEAGQATADSLNTEPVRLLAIRFGEELRRRRREAGLHQHDLADRIAYHRPYLSQVERGRQVPPEQVAMLRDRAPAPPAARPGCTSTTWPPASPITGRTSRRLNAAARYPPSSSPCCATERSRP